MNLDISSGSSLRLAPTPQPAVPGAGAGARAAAAEATPAVPATPAAPKVQTPVKPQVDFDPEEMRRDLQEAIQNLNDQLRSRSSSLSFAVDEVADRTVVTVKNLQTGEVVRQIPNEVVIRIAHNLEEMKGLLLNEQG